MINFRRITISDKDMIKSYVLAGDTDGSVYSFGSLFCWGETYNLEIAEYNDFLIIRGKDNFGRYYAYPSGCGDIQSVIEKIIQICADEGTELRFVQLLSDNKDSLQKMFPNKFDFSYNRDSSEYVYSVKNMSDLPGKKFHGKKGHVNAFFRNHINISCDPITKDNINECITIAKSWLSVKDGNDELYAEFEAIENAVKYYDSLEYDGVILYADEKAVAFTMGEKIKNNTFCTHFEKTLPDYRDAYPVINNGFTKLMLMSYDYINREEDTGSQGLRKAKLSYYPEFLLDKYSAVLKYEPLRKFKVNQSDVPNLKSLWKTVFGDSDDVVDFFFDNTVDLNNVYAYKDNGKCVSAFYLIDVPIKEGRILKKSMYLYAAATLPEYRKKGIMSKMIEYAAARLKLSGFDYLYLYPANNELYTFYEKFGFKSVFKEKIYSIKAEDLVVYKNVRYFDTSLSYPEMREYICAKNYASFNVDFLDFASFCSKKFGVIKCAIFDDEDKVFVIGNEDADGTLNIVEAFSSYGQPEHILALVADMNYKNIRIHTAADFDAYPFDSKIENSGMMCFLNENNDEVYYIGQPVM